MILRHFMINRKPQKFNYAQSRLLYLYAGYPLRAGTAPEFPDECILPRPNTRLIRSSYKDVGLIHVAGGSSLTDLLGHIHPTIPLRDSNNDQVQAVHVAGQE